MKTNIDLQFAIAATLMTAGCLLVLYGVPNAGWVIMAAAFVTTEASEWTRPIRGSELLAAVAVLAAFAVALCARIFVSDFLSDLIGRTTKSPVFLVPVCFLILYMLFRNWQQRRIEVAR